MRLTAFSSTSRAMASAMAAGEQQHEQPSHPFHRSPPHHTHTHSASCFLFPLPTFPPHLCPSSLSLAHDDARYIHELKMTSVIPARGSIGGGTQLTIRGDGFSDDLEELAVRVGYVPCEVTRATTAELICVTGARAETEDDAFALLNQSVARSDLGFNSAFVSVRSRGMDVPCMGSSACEFSYHVDSTPLIEPSCFSALLNGDGSWTLTLCGSGFMTPSEANQVWVGGATGGHHGR